MIFSRNGERGGGGDVQELTWTTNNVTQQGDSLEGFGPDLEVDRHSKLEQRKSPSISSNTFLSCSLVTLVDTVAI